MKHYFLGMAANYSASQMWRHTFAWGRKSDCRALKRYLRERYGGKDDDDTKVILAKNGRSALCLALKAYFQPGDAVIVNGFTCYAVYEAVKAAGLTPIWVDISKEDLNFDPAVLNARIGQSESICDNGSNRRSEPCDDRREQGGSRSDQFRIQHDRAPIQGIVIQNTLGNPVDIAAVEKFAKRHGFIIIEDLAHSAGVKYPDGREAGMVGAAAVFSFGKDKSIDTISGGAVVLREPCRHEIKRPTKAPRPSDHLRARFYPLFGAICRGLTRIRLGGALMRLLVKIHWVEKSADNELDLDRKISKFEAKLALEQFKKLNKSGERPLRGFYLVEDRELVLKELMKSGYYFSGFWYEKPVSPERYYKKVHFPEEECPNAVYVSRHIINLPNHYTKKELAPAVKIISQHVVREKSNG